MDRWSITVCSPLYNIDIHIYQIKNYDKSTQKLKLDIFQFRTSTRISKKNTFFGVVHSLLFFMQRCCCHFILYIYVYQLLLLDFAPCASTNCCFGRNQQRTRALRNYRNFSWIFEKSLEFLEFWNDYIWGQIPVQWWNSCVNLAYFWNSSPLHLFYCCILYFSSKRSGRRVKRD